VAFVLSSSCGRELTSETGFFFIIGGSFRGLPTLAPTVSSRGGGCGGDCSAASPLVLRQAQLGRLGEQELEQLPQHVSYLPSSRCS